MLKQVGIQWEKNKSIEIALHMLKITLDSIDNNNNKKNVVAGDDLNFEQVLDQMTTSSTTKFDDLKTVLSKQSLSSKSLLVAPERLDIIGSYLLRSVAKPNEHVDVALTIPSKLLKKSDISNHKYYAIRAAYLLMIAKYLSSVPMFENVQIQAFKDDCLKPILVITPKRDEKLAPKFTKTKFKIRLFVALPAHVFGDDETQLGIDKSNIKKSKASATPYYNHGILEDKYFKAHLETIHEYMIDCTSLVESSILLKVWSKQRGIYYSYDGVNGFLLTMLLVYLMSRNQINKHMSSFQMMKQLMQWIVSHDLSKKGVSFSQDNKASKEPIKSFGQVFDCVLLDEENRFNIFHRVSKSAWHELQHEARLTLQYFDDDQKVEAIQALFLTKHNIWHKYDAHVCISKVNSIKKVDTSDHSRGIAIRKSIMHYLTLAFGERIQYLRLVDNETIQSSVVKKGQVLNPKDNIIIGLMLNKQWDETIVVGPSPTLKKEAEAFKDLWGEMFEVKTLGNGKTVLAAEFDLSDKPKLSIFEEIAKFILHAHMKVQKSRVSLLALESFGGMIANTTDQIIIKRKIVEAFERVKESLTEADINLSIKDVSFASPEPLNLSLKENLVNETIRSVEQRTFKFKYPEEDDVPSSLSEHSVFVTPIRLIMEFFDNSNWPDNVTALQRLKQLIYIKLSELLQSVRLLSVPNLNWIDILCQGYAFRVIICLPKEIQVYKSTGNAIDPKLIAMEKALIHIPQHYKHISIFTNKFAAYAGAVQLAKRWVNAHLFSDYIEEQLIELLVAYVFASPYPYEAPQTPICGFIRFISLLRTHAWNNTPLCVNFVLEDDAKAKEEGSFAEAVREEYNALPTKPAMYVVSSHSKQLKNIFSKGLDAMIVNRLVLCARNSEQQIIKMFTDQLELEDESESSTFFEPNLDVYDVLVHINQAFITDNNELVNEKEYREQMNIKKQKSENIALGELSIGFDPISMYVNDLRKRLEDVGLIFRNSARNDIIAIVWNPTAFLPSSFNMTKTTGMFPLEHTQCTKVIPNVFELLHDIKNLGKGLIEKVEMVSKSQKLPKLSISFESQQTNEVSVTPAQQTTESEDTTSEQVPSEEENKSTKGKKRKASQEPKTKKSKKSKK